MLKKGQSILEYMVILAVIIAAVVAGASFIRSSTSEGLEDASGAMSESTGRFRDRIGQ